MNAELQAALDTIPDNSVLRELPESALAAAVETLGGVFAAALIEA